jgi:hypothetical protein
MENSPHVERQPVASNRSRNQRFAILGGAAVIVALGATVFPQLGSGILPQRILLASVAPTDTAVEMLLAQPIWSEVRGDGEAGLSAEARAVRVGAAIAELELRSRRADSSARAAAERVAGLLETFPRAGDAVNAFRSLGAPPDDSALRTATGIAERVAGARAVRLGAWLQSARFAVATGDSSPFDRSVIRSVSLAAITIDDRAGTEYAARQLEDVTRQRPHNWTSIATSLEELLHLLGAR